LSLSLFSFNLLRMKTIQVVLSPEHEKLVAEKMATGNYYAPSEVVAEALWLLYDQDLLREAKLQVLRKEIQIGIDQLDRGEVIEI